MPGELSLEELLMQGVGTTADDDIRQQEDVETNVEGNLPPIKDEMDINSILSQSTEDDEDNEDNNPGEEEADKDVGKAPDSSKSTKETKKSNGSDEPFTLAFARYQLEQGNLTSLDEDELRKVIEEEGEAAGMSYIQNKEAEHIRNSLLDTYEEDVKYYLDLLDSGVSHDVARNISKAKHYYDNIKEVELEDDEKEDLRKDIMTQYYKLTTKFSDAKIKKEIESKVALGEDIEFTKEALPEIKEYFKEAGENEKKVIAQQKLKQQEETRARMQEFAKKVEDLQEIVPGVKLNKPTKDRLRDMITKPVKEVNGVQLNSIWARRAADPDTFDITLAALIDYGVFDGKWDKIVKATKSKAAEDIEQVIRSTGANYKSGFSRTKTAPTTTTDAGTASLESLKSAFSKL